MSTVANAVLLEIGSLELDAASLITTEPRHEHAEPARSAVDLVLLLGVGSADRGIIRTGEGLLTNAVAGVVVDLVLAVLGLLAVRGRRRGRGVVAARVVTALVVTVGSSDNDLEVVAATASVSGGILCDLLSPDRALVVDGRGRLIARALRRVPCGITLDVDVEASAGLDGVAELGAACYIVAVKGLVRDVTTASGSTLEVDEGLGVASGSLGRDSELLVVRVVQETVNGIILGRCASTCGLRSTGVLGVDEAAVGANLDSSRASRDASEGIGVGPGDRCAGGGDNNAGWGCGDDSWGSGRRTGVGARLRLRLRLGSRVGVLLGPQPPESASLKGPLVEAPLGGSSGSRTCRGSGSDRLGRALDIGSLLSRANTDRRTVCKDSGIKVGKVESLRSRASGDEGSSPEDDCVTHRKGCLYE